jgi:hypothetical protein
MQLSPQTPAAQQQSTKIIITDDVKEQWIEEAVQQLGGGVEIRCSTSRFSKKRLYA